MKIKNRKNQKIERDNIMTDHQHVGNSKTSNINDQRSPHKPNEHRAHKVVKPNTEKK